MEISPSEAGGYVLLLSHERRIATTFHTCLSQPDTRQLSLLTVESLFETHHRSVVAGPFHYPQETSCLCSGRDDLQGTVMWRYFSNLRGSLQDKVSGWKYDGRTHNEAGPSTYPQCRRLLTQKDGSISPQVGLGVGVPSTHTFFRSDQSSLAKLGS